MQPRLTDYRRETSIGSLIATVVTLQMARALIDEEIRFSQSCFRNDGKDAAHRERSGFLEQDAIYLDSRIESLILRIRRSPIRTKNDAFERLRFEVLVYSQTGVIQEIEIDLLRDLLDFLEKKMGEDNRSLGDHLRSGYPIPNQ